MSLPRREKNKQVAKEVQHRESVISLLQITSHSISVDSNRLTCSICLNSFSCLDAACKPWLKSQCNPPTISKAGNCHEKLALDAGFHLGNKSIHISHNLFKFKEFIYCAR